MTHIHFTHRNLKGCFAVPSHMVAETLAWLADKGYVVR